MQRQTYKSRQKVITCIKLKLMHTTCVPTNVCVIADAHFSTESSFVYLIRAFTAIVAKF